jgi:hypothetical protein
VREPVAADEAKKANLGYAVVLATRYLFGPIRIATGTSADASA